jgi:hypothetical protein
MNEHLEFVFKNLLPKLEKAGIDYFVYGGVSIAAYVGKFIRNNKDVDTFVRDTDFDKAKSILKSLCKPNEKYKFKCYCPEKGNEKHKIDIKYDNIRYDNEKIFSVVAAYQKNNIIEFKYSSKHGGNEEYSKQILERTERNISGYRFFTPPDRFIKEIFINHIKARPGKKKRESFQKDAIAILSSEERAGLDWDID